MELPHIGKTCSDKSCKRLDFLPMKCDACHQIFCGDHIMYEAHQCTESYKKNNQIPVCPLCNTPCPVRKGELPDVVVGRHIESDCQSDPAKERRKVYTNRCSVKGCKKKELIPVTCDTCRLNFCLRHRHPADHECKGFQGSGRGVSNAGAAALFRFQQSSSSKSSASAASRPANTRPNTNRNASSQPPRPPHPTAVSSLQGSLSEDEALARALQQSMAQAQQPPPQPSDLPPVPEGLTAQEREDFLLAQALSMSEAQARPPAQATTASNSGKQSCEVQ